jgi:hypothetical protein
MKSGRRTGRIEPDSVSRICVKTGNGQGNNLAFLDHLIQLCINQKSLTNTFYFSYSDKKTINSPKNERNFRVVRPVRRKQAEL